MFLVFHPTTKLISIFTFSSLLDEREKWKVFAYSSLECEAVFIIFFVCVIFATKEGVSHSVWVALCGK